MANEEKVFTVGQWRQGAKCFEILYPPDEHDWREPSVLVSPAPSEPLSVVSYSPERCHVISRACLTDGAFLEVTTVSSLYLGQRADAGPLGFVDSFVSTEQHLSPDGTLDVERFKRTATHTGVVALDLGYLKVEPYLSAAANTPVSELLVSTGADLSGAMRVVQLASRATEVVNALVGGTYDPLGLFPNSSK